MNPEIKPEMQQQQQQKKKKKRTYLLTPNPGTLISSLPPEQYCIKLTPFIIPHKVLQMQEK